MSPPSRCNNLVRRRKEPGATVQDERTKSLKPEREVEEVWRQQAGTLLGSGREAEGGGGGAGPELLRGSQTLLITGRMFAEGLLSRAVM